MTAQPSPPDLPRPWWRRWWAALYLALLALTAAGTAVTPHDTIGGTFFRIGLLLVLAAAIVSFAFAACSSGCALPRPAR